MGKSRFLPILNVLLFFAVLFQAATGIFEERLDETFFEHYHPLVGFIMTALVIIHLVLNWGWVKVHIFRLRPR